MALKAHNLNPHWKLEHSHVYRELYTFAERE